MNSPVSERTRGTPALVAITLWIYARLLFLHPPAFRGDFGTDIVQVFRQLCLDAYHQRGAAGVARLWLPALDDVLRGAVAEHSSRLLSIRGATMQMRYRRSASVIFACFIAFVLAGIGFVKAYEDILRSSVPAAHPILTTAYDGVAIGAMLALLAVLAGGIPILLATLSYALRDRRRDILARLAVPPLALLVICLYLKVLLWLNVGGNTVATIHTWQRILGVGSGALVFVIAAVLSTAAVLDAVNRAEVHERLLRFSLVPGALAILGMVVTLVSHLVFSVALWQYAPSHFFGNDGFLASSTLVNTLLTVATMLAAVLVAALALSQGLGTRRGAPQPA